MQVSNTVLVLTWRRQEHFLRVLEVVRCIPKNRDCSEDSIVELQKQVYVDFCARECGQEAKHEDGSTAEDILVQNVVACVRIPAVTFATMHEEQVLQVLELSNCIIRSLYSLLTLKATDTDTDVCGIDHVDIVCSVSNRKGCILGEPDLNQIHNLSLLLGADSAGQYDISF